MPEIDFISSIHKKTNRNYLERVCEFPKAEAAAVAKKFDFDSCMDHCKMKELFDFVDKWKKYGIEL